MLGELEDIRMRDYAINVAMSMISRTMTMIEWRVREDGRNVRDKTYHKLNVKPNENESAAVFWEKFIRKLFYEDGEVLVLLIDDQMVIADNFHHHRFAIKPDYFTEVRVGNHTFDKKPFYMEDVLYLEQKNRKLKSLIAHLDDSYGMMFGRIVEVAMRTNQVRATAKISGRLAGRKDGEDVLQAYIDKLYESFNSRSVAIAPEQDGLEYKEHSRDTTNRSVVSDAIQAGDAYVEKVLIACGIHPSLVYGDMADTEKHQQQFILNVINPLAKMIENEINAKMFTAKEYQEGKRVEFSNLRANNNTVFDMAVAIEKLVGSNTFTPNDVREAAGYERSDAEGMDDFYITKNIETHNDGENKSERT